MKDENLQQFEHSALEALAEHGDKIITCGLRVMDAVCIAGCVNLASRHPGNRGHSAQRAGAFVVRLAEQLAGLDPALGELVRRGLDPAYDVSVVPQPGPDLPPRAAPFGRADESLPIDGVKDELAGLVNWCRRNPDATVSLSSRMVTAIAERVLTNEDGPVAGAEITGGTQPEIPY